MTSWWHCAHSIKLLVNFLFHFKTFYESTHEAPVKGTHLTLKYYIMRTTNLLTDRNYVFVLKRKILRKDGSNFPQNKYYMWKHNTSYLHCFLTLSFQSLHVHFFIFTHIFDGIKWGFGFGPQKGSHFMFNYSVERLLWNCILKINFLHGNWKLATACSVILTLFVSIARRQPIQIIIH